MEIVNKITMKSIGAQPKANSVEAPREVAHIFGVARSFKTGSSNYGFFEKFVGDFEAVNTETGEVYASQTLLVPSIVEQLLKGALTAAGAEAGKVGAPGTRGQDVDGKVADTPVEFAFIVGVKPTTKREGANAGQGYEFTVKPMIESKRSDTLASLREVSQKARKALPAPEAQKEQHKAGTSSKK